MKELKKDINKIGKTAEEKKKNELGLARGGYNTRKVAIDQRTGERLDQKPTGNAKPTLRQTSSKPDEQNGANIRKQQTMFGQNQIRKT